MCIEQRVKCCKLFSFHINEFGAFSDGDVRNKNHIAIIRSRSIVEEITQLASQVSRGPDAKPEYV